MVLDMKCKRCGRVLKTEKSITLGYGQRCFKKICEEKKYQKCILEYI
jgi:hypothetical protein